MLFINVINLNDSLGDAMLLVKDRDCDASANLAELQLREILFIRDQELLCFISFG